MVTTVMLGPVVPVMASHAPCVPGVFLNALLASDPTPAFHLWGATGAVTRPALVREDGHLCARGYISMVTALAIPFSVFTGFKAAAVPLGPDK